MTATTYDLPPARRIRQPWSIEKNGTGIEKNGTGIRGEHVE